MLAGGGRLPPLVAAAAREKGLSPIVFAIAGEAEPRAFDPSPVHVVRWGEIGRLFRLTEESGCRDAVFVGSIAKRPDYRTIRPDLGAVRLIPRILQLMSRRDDSLLAGVARIFGEKGLQVLSPLEIAPELALPAGCSVGEIGPDALRDIAAGVEAARRVGRLDIAQGAVALDGRVVAVEDAGGTDALLERVGLLRRSGVIPKSGGVLVKCMKPQQDGRHDLPTIGPDTAEAAARAGLSGVAGEAGRAILVGKNETLDAFQRAGLFLFGMDAPPSGHG
jgi:hypothetical protein